MKTLLMLVCLLGGSFASAQTPTTQTLTAEAVGTTLGWAAQDAPLCTLVGKTYRVASYRVNLPLFLMRQYGFRTVTAAPLAGAGFFKDFGTQVWTTDPAGFALYEVSTGSPRTPGTTIQFYLDAHERYSTDVCIRVIN